MPTPPTCSIIIPVYNNHRALTHTVTALYQQTIPHLASLEIIFSDDGSTGATPRHLKQLVGQSPWPHHLITGPHAGAATARNRALQHATGHFLLWLGADIILQPGALAAHLEFHQRHPAPTDAALGFITWDPALAPSPLMEWLIHGGPQNNFDAILGRHTVPPAHYFYGSHISIKRTILPPRPFHEDFATYGWEDLELGRRLASAITLHVLPHAHALHRHHYQPADVFRRQYHAGYNLVHYQSLYPTATLLPAQPKRRHLKHRLAAALGLIHILKIATAWLGQRYSLPRLFQATCTAIFWQGIIAAQQPERYAKK